MIKKTLLYLASSITLLVIMAFVDKQANTFSISGEFQNLHPRFLKISYTDPDSGYRVLSVPIKDGKFKITTPLNTLHLATLDVDTLLRRTLAIAPGYRLNLNVSNNREVTYSGPGSKVNQLAAGLDSVLRLKRAFGTEKSEYLKSLIIDRNHKATSFNSLLARYKDPNDKYFESFRKIFLADIEFSRLDRVMMYLVSNFDKYSDAEIKQVMENGFSSAVLQNISNPENLRSPAFQFLMGNGFSYLFFLTRLDQRENPSGVLNFSSYLNKINEAYKGKVKDFVIYSFIQLNVITAANSYEKFKERQEASLPFIATLRDVRYKMEITRALNIKEFDLIDKQVGKVAIPFTLRDSASNQYTLSDFKGKVVLIDFWASWCLPCREENIFIKVLYEKYKTDERLEVLSIGVKDRYDHWRKAIIKDKPSWRQLFDSDGSMAAAYMTAELPRFVIIDRNGMIANFQAPMPRDGDFLEKMLLTEINKK